MPKRYSNPQWAETVLDAMKSYTGITLDDLKEKTRKESVCNNRALFCFLCYKNGSRTGCTQIEIAKILECYPASVCQNIIRHSELLKKDKEYRSLHVKIQNYLDNEKFGMWAIFVNDEPVLGSVGFYNDSIASVHGSNYCKCKITKA